MKTCDFCPIVISYYNTPELKPQNNNDIMIMPSHTYSRWSIEALKVLHLSYNECTTHTTYARDTLPGSLGSSGPIMSALYFWTSCQGPVKLSPVSMINVLIICLLSLTWHHHWWLYQMMSYQPRTLTPVKVNTEPKSNITYPREQTLLAIQSGTSHTQL